MELVVKLPSGEARWYVLLLRLACVCLTDLRKVNVEMGFFGELGLEGCGSARTRLTYQGRDGLRAHLETSILSIELEVV